jgi:predicted RND superfamily exporter protein
MKGGAISILVTSLTDALAFLIGASTVMPALRWFCLFAGFGIIFCFLFQITMYMPFLCLNERRARANKLDCCICIEAAQPHDIDEPQGCCGLLCAGYTPGKLGRFLQETWAPLITSQAGMGASVVFFAGLFIAAIVGVTQVRASHHQ